MTEWRRLSKAEVDEFFADQLEEWPMARDNFAALSGVRLKTVKVGKATFKVQFNPARMRSSAAKIDAASLKARACFLCDANRPKEQKGIAWHGDYKIMVNPYPIFPKHLTIPSKQHTAQSIVRRMGDMMELAQELEDYEIFYNGPKCGASAPDHMHFQAGVKGFMPLASDLKNAERTEVKRVGTAHLSAVNGLGRTAFIIEADNENSGVALFDALMAELPTAEGEAEPMLNLLCRYDEGAWTVTIFPRKKHRPSCYYAEGEDNILISPASVDMGGVLVVPLEKDFEKLGEKEIAEILDEVCIGPEETQKIIERLK